MKILLVDNNTAHLQKLSLALAGHRIERQVYKPGIEFRHRGKDLVILSGGGGEGLEINDLLHRGKLWYQDEMEFVLSCNKPIIGICMGFEVIARAYGEKIENLGYLVEGPQTVHSTKKGQSVLDLPMLEQFESHYWRVQKAPKDFEVLAQSDTGIEIIRHKKLPVIATQFHPEFPGSTLNLKQLTQHTFLV